MADPLPINVLYTDEDVNGPAIEIARNLDPRVTVVTAAEAGLLETHDDDVHFRYAIEQGYVLVTGNIKDFRLLWSAWLAAGHEHPGIVFITPQHQKNSTLIASMLVLLAYAPMKNRDEWV